MRLRTSSLLALLLLTAACGKTLEKQTRDQVRTFSGADLDSKSITVTGIQEAGGHATAELTLRTTVKLKAEGSHWVLDEIRIGEDRWEKAERILEAIESGRRRDTLARLAELREGLQAFRREQGSAIAFRDFRELMDALAPRFVPEARRLDGWQVPFQYSILKSGAAELRSAGPDREFGTEDDLVQPL